MLCQRCQERESTGMLIHLCDKCFDEWEAEVRANPKTADVGPMDLACKYQKAGGLVPDKAKGIRIRGHASDVRVDIVN